jgi:hypothetical protein
MLLDAVKLAVLELLDLIGLLHPPVECGSPTDALPEVSAQTAHTLVSLVSEV